MPDCDGSTNPKSPPAPTSTAGGEPNLQQRVQSRLEAYATGAGIHIDTLAISDKVAQWLAQCRRYQQHLSGRGQGALPRRGMKATADLASRLLAMLDGLNAWPATGDAADFLLADNAASRAIPMIDVGTGFTLSARSRKAAFETHLHLQELLGALAASTMPLAVVHSAATLRSRLDQQDATVATEAMLLGHDDVVSGRAAPSAVPALRTYLAMAAAGYAALAHLELVQARGRSKRDDSLVLAVEGLVAIWRSSVGGEPNLSVYRSGVLAFCEAVIPAAGGVSPAGIRHALNQVIEGLDAKGMATRKRRRRMVYRA